MDFNENSNKIQEEIDTLGQRTFIVTASNHKRTKAKTLKLDRGSSGFEVKVLEQFCDLHRAV